LNWREANMYRAMARYLELGGYPLGKRYMSQVLAQYAPVTHMLRDLFMTRLDPAKGNQTEIDRLVSVIEAELEKVDKLDEDRVLRSFLNLTQNILRTNYFQVDENGQP